MTAEVWILDFFFLGMGTQEFLLRMAMGFLMSNIFAVNFQL